VVVVLEDFDKGTKDDEHAAKHGGPFATEFVAGDGGGNQSDEI
jgi:hypothetical protein